MPNEVVVVPRETYEDRQIAEDVVATLKRSPYVDAARVNVKVRDGVVTLAGHVPDQRAYNADQRATKYAPGVVDVIREVLVETE